MRRVAVATAVGHASHGHALRVGMGRERPMGRESGGGQNLEGEAGAKVYIYFLDSDVKTEKQRRS